MYTEKNFKKVINFKILITQMHKVAYNFNKVFDTFP